MKENTDFYFFADFLRKQVLDGSGRPLGTICDLAMGLGDPHPKATHLVVRRRWPRSGYAAIPWERVERILATVQTNVAPEDLSFGPEPPAHEFAVGRDILDKQVVDTAGHKVIRVNDVYLMRTGKDLRLSHVDVGLRGIVRRLGWQWWADPFAQTFLARTEYLKDKLINWHLIQPLAINPQQGTLKLTVNHKQLSMIPRADFSEMMESMDMHQRLALFNSIPADLRPKIFSDFSLELQKELLENLDLQEAATLLAQIPTDQTTDLLEEIPQSIADSLLALMETKLARRLSGLLGYTSDSAGGLMTTEMLVCPAGAPVSDAVTLVRQMAENVEMVSHVFLVDAENRLTGQVPLQKLLFASPSDPLSRHAASKPVFVRAKDSLREVAFVMEKYKVPTIPVVNNGKERLLQGVITIDDILARVIPLAWKRRMAGAKGS